MKSLRNHLRALRRRRQLAKHAKLRAAKNHDNEVRKRKRKAEKRLTRVIAAVKLRIKGRKARRDPRFDPSMLGGLPGNVTDKVKEIIAWGDVRFGMVVTATSNGGHAPGSYHYREPCEAVDQWHSSVSTMVAFQRFIYEKWGPQAFNELFGPDGFYVKNGVRVAGYFPGHGDHTHAAPR